MNERISSQGRRLRALLWMPGTSPFGGHSVQVASTVRALNEREMVHAAFSDDPNVDCADMDVVHGFGLTAEQARNVRRQGIPVVLSPIYLPADYMMGASAPRTLAQEIFGRARIAAVLALSAVRGRHPAKVRALADWFATTRSLYEAVDMLLPNSRLEALQIRKDLGVSTPMHVVPNAVDPEIFALSSDPLTRSGVVCVARIEPHKNQLRLIAAMRATGLALTIVGDPNPDHHDYYAACRRAGRGWVDFVPRVEHGPAVAEIYRSASVHVLPSYVETTGLVSLEAALCGCAVVTTDRGYATEYFAELADYCDPEDVRSIRAAVDRAAAREDGSLLRERILDRYTWSRTAEETAAAYRSVLSAQRNRPYTSR